MKPQYQTRYELLHESYQKWLTGFTRHAVSWGVCHPICCLLSPVRNMKMKPQYQTRYELLHESYQKWLTGFTRHAVSWGVCHPNIYYFHNLTPG